MRASRSSSTKPEVPSASRDSNRRTRRDISGPPSRVRRSARGSDDMKPVPPSRSTARARVVEWRPMRRSPSIRSAKVLTAQARISVGYYDREDVKDALLDALMKELATN